MHSLISFAWFQSCRLFCKAQTGFLSVIMDLQSDAVLLGQAYAWGSDSEVQPAHSQLTELIQAGLPRKSPKVHKLRGLALRRDVWALLQSKPEFDISNVPDELSSFPSFDAILHKIASRMCRIAHISRHRDCLSQAQLGHGKDISWRKISLRPVG